MIRVLLISAFLLTGCASQVASFLGFGAPVTKERCEALDMRALGVTDGTTAQRPGEKFEYWVKDCRQTGVKLDRALYDQGYSEGMMVYCSCESGFATGVKDEVLGLKGQHFNCSRQENELFLKAHEAGKKYMTDAAFVTKINHYKNEYNEPAIQAKATEECAQLSRVQAEEKKAPGTSKK